VPTERRWSAGDVVVLREVWRGRVWSARPEIVVEDADAGSMFYLPDGVRWKTAARGGELLRIPDGGDWELGERVWTKGPILSWAWPGVAHAVLLFFHPDWSVWNWYVNLQDPLRRTAMGFDTVDHVLDAIVEPDGSWRWKDEDELEKVIARGAFTPAQADAFRAEGERGVRRILDREPPFDRDWTTWRPDPSWPIAELPPGWDAL